MKASDTIKSLIADHFGKQIGEINEGTNLNEDLEADDLHRLELVMTLEEEFGQRIPDEDAARLDTVGDVIKYMTDTLGAKNEDS